jgi:hypothetical protein
MLKINKTTHIMILSTFAIVFIVVYLYYTINDVKKLSAEVKKNAADITKLTQDIQNAMNVITNLNADVLEVRGNNMGSVMRQKTQSQSQSKSKIEIKDDESEQSSVDSQLLKNILVGHDDEDYEDGTVEEVIEGVEDADVKQNIEDNVTQKEENKVVDYKSMKYDELKEIAKRKGISSKGTKDQLVAKLESAS